VNIAGFIEWDQVPVLELSPGVRIRTPSGQHLMLSLVEFDAGAVVPAHSHPHEQAGMVLEGRMRFTIGAQSRIVEPGGSYIVPPDVPHSAAAVDGPVRTLDIFSPPREDYVRGDNRFVPDAASPG
jgi:quercetin dioxygenase-like cupin family protein